MTTTEARTCELYGDASDIRTAFHDAHLFASTDRNRDSVRCVRVIHETNPVNGFGVDVGTWVHLVATDTYTIADVPLMVDSSGPEGEFSIPLLAVRDMLKALPKTGRVSIILDPGKATFSVHHGTGSYSGTLEIGPYPEWRELFSRYQGAPCEPAILDPAYLGRFGKMKTEGAVHLATHGTGSPTTFTIGDIRGLIMPRKA